MADKREKMADQIDAFKSIRWLVQSSVLPDLTNFLLSHAMHY